MQKLSEVTFADSLIGEPRSGATFGVFVRVTIPLLSSTYFLISIDFINSILMAAYDNDIHITNKPPRVISASDYSIWVIRLQSFLFYNDPELWNSITDGTHIPRASTANGGLILDPKTMDIDYKLKDVDINEKLLGSLPSVWYRCSWHWLSFYGDGNFKQFSKEKKVTKEVDPEVEIANNSVLFIHCKLTNDEVNQLLTEHEVVLQEINNDEEVKALKKQDVELILTTEPRPCPWNMKVVHERLQKQKNMRRKEICVQAEVEQWKTANVSEEKDRGKVYDQHKKQLQKNPGEYYKESFKKFVMEGSQKSAAVTKTEKNKTVFKKQNNQKKTTSQSKLSAKSVCKKQIYEIKAVKKIAKKVCADQSVASTSQPVFEKFNKREYREVSKLLSSKLSTGFQNKLRFSVIHLSLSECNCSCDSSCPAVEFLFPPSKP
ncbi:hypothetical protein L1987_38854 [Smallanthus sonchifolius]|uniref:Uncharacterized protein n=1 Tax=Smallanthus sonchifolius TaxID=185202 RepID=A0ACB9HKE6_9ASTR|nr:hypothetical protein L1987_38854 [Smallanthus sonchifolius]